MCGVMKSFWSAIIFEQQWFGHHRQKEKRHQTYERRFHGDVNDPRQRRVQHENKKSENCPYSPAEHQLAGRAVAGPGRSQQRVRAELYCESQSSGNEHRVVLIHRPEVRPQNDGADDDERGRDSSEEADRALLLHRSPFALPSSRWRLVFRSSSSFFCAAVILRYML